jgi:hypothetical protein
MLKNILYLFLFFSSFCLSAYEYTYSSAGHRIAQTKNTGNVSSVTMVHTADNLAIKYVNGGGASGTTSYDFIVTITPAPIQVPVPSDFLVSSGCQVTGVSQIGNTANYTVTVQPSLSVGATTEATFGITGVSGTPSIPLRWGEPTTNQIYSIRRIFSTTATLLPAHNATNVSIDGTIKVSFNEEVVGANQIIATLNDTINVTLTKNGNFYTGYYSSLTKNMLYTVTFASGAVKDAWDNNWNPMWSFRIESGIVSNAQIQTMGFSDVQKSSFIISWTTAGSAIGAIIWITDELPTISPTAPPTYNTTGSPTGLGVWYVTNNTSVARGKIKWDGLQSNTRYYAILWAYDGSMYSSNCLIDSVTTTRRKDGFSEESIFTTFTVSEITPHPVEDEAEFRIAVEEAGLMNVIIYDITGSKIMDVITDGFIDANTEIRVPLNVADLASGMYSIMISVGNDKVVRTFIKK